MAEEDKVVSPGEARPAAKADTEADAARRRLIELADTLSERFDRAAWLEYLRLRRAGARQRESLPRVY